MRTMTVSVVSIKCGLKNGKWNWSGVGLKVKDCILAHYSIVGSDLSYQKFDSDQTLDICFQEENQSCYKKRRVKVICVWTCNSFEKFFETYFNVKDFGDQNVPTCASFLLLSLNDTLESRQLDVRRIFQEIRAALSSQPAISQGTRICSNTNKELTWKSPHQDDENSGIISYTFDTKAFFTIDLNVSPGSIIFRHPNGTGDVSFLGIVVFKDLLPYPFQVFPVCISLKHLLSGECHVSRCSILFEPAFLRKGLSDSSVLSDYSFLVCCGNNVGSGSLIAENVVLTCSHIILDHIKSGVEVYYKRTFIKAQVIFSAENVWPDIALLQLIGSHNYKPVLPFVEQTPLIGEQIFAVGIPYIKGWYRKDAWISSGRVISYDPEEMIASCPVHEGFSGGSVVDTRGRMMGIIRGKAFPLRGDSPPPRLTSVVPILLMKEHILKFVASQRSLSDILKLTRVLQETRKVRSNL